MEDKGNIFLKLLTLITYKEPNKVKDFYIPEIDEGAFQQNSGQIKGQSKKTRNIKAVKIPTPVGKIKEAGKTPNGEQIFNNIDQNLDYIKTQFNYPANKDLIIREFTIADKHKAFIINLEGMVDRTTVNNFILRPLFEKHNSFDTIKNPNFFNSLSSIIEINQIKQLKTQSETITEIILGNTCLYIDGCDYYVGCETKGFEKRGVEKPQNENIVKGSQEGFNENLRTNITLIRRIVKNKDLTTEFLPIGNQNNNMCAIMYLNSIVNPAIITEIKRRIRSLKADYIAGSGMLEQFIEDHPLSIIPTVLSTERPDKAASHIIEGRVSIIADGTPYAIVVPITIHALLHSPEDASLKWQYGTLLRLIRAFALAISILLPGLYVALTNYHREMIPTDLLVAIAQARENVPFPTIVEVLLMEISFELIREAGIRVPGVIGNTIGIIGALIIGQAAVQANIVSPVLIIIVAFTGLGSFAVPNFSLAFGARILRLFYIVLGSILGFYGISLGIVGFLTMLANTESFGIPIYSPTAPRTRRSTDLFIREPVWKQELRPDDLNTQDERMQPKISREWTTEDADVPDTMQKGDGQNE